MNGIDHDNDMLTETSTESSEAAAAEKKSDFIGGFYELADMIAAVTVVVLLLFAFIGRISIVDGPSMEQTLYHNDHLLVWQFLYEPEAGDIVLVHDISADPYSETIVKRVVAVGGQTVDIDFDTWTLTVDGEVIEEDYRYLSDSPTLTADYSFPITLAEDEVFVLGDNRNHSADSRQIEIGPIDKRCIIGKAVARYFPLDRIEIFD